MKDYSLIYSPIGGAGEIGMNMYAYGFRKYNKISYILVDAGVSFPKMDTEPGVDLIFPNPKLILDNLKDLEGIFITHAHEDHLGAIGFIASKIDCKIFCRKFTSEIVKDKLKKVLDSDRVRPTDITLQIPDSTKFRDKTGWKPTKGLEEICDDLLDYWRNIGDLY